MVDSPKSFEFVSTPTLLHPACQTHANREIFDNLNRISSFDRTSILEEFGANSVFGEKLILDGLNIHPIWLRGCISGIDI
jgi:hypothetical protein